MTLRAETGTTFDLFLPFVCKTVPLPLGIERLSQMHAFTAEDNHRRLLREHIRVNSIQGISAAIQSREID
jgi:hypothetical protein